MLGDYPVKSWVSRRKDAIGREREMVIGRGHACQAITRDNVIKLSYCGQHGHQGSGELRTLIMVRLLAAEPGSLDELKMLLSESR